MAIDRRPNTDRRKERALSRHATIGLADGTSIILVNGSYSIVLATNSGLSKTAGLKILLDTDPGLVLGAGGVKVLLGTNPGLTTSGGLKVLLDTNSSLSLGAGGLKLQLNTSTPGLTISASGVMVYLDGDSLALASTGLKVNLGGNSGLIISTGLKIRLDTDPGLVLGAGGIKILLDGDSLILGASGLKVKLDGNSGLTISTGLKILLDGGATASGLIIGASGIKVAPDTARGLSLTANGIGMTYPIIPLFDHYTDAGNSTTTETDLYSDTIPAGRLANDGDKLVCEYAGIFVPSETATRNVMVYFGGTKIFDGSTIENIIRNTSPFNWNLSVLIIRISATAVRYSIVLKVTEQTAGDTPIHNAVGELTGLTLSNTNVLKITGQATGVGAATNDVVAKLGTVIYYSKA